jgi:hypothetical protein
MPMVSKIFPDEAFYSVALYSTTDLSGHSNTQPAPIQTTRRIYRYKMIVLDSAADFGKLDILIAL